MWLKHPEKHVEGEPRYDAEAVRKVAALAARLQGQQQEGVTAQEMEAIGAEVGLESAFIRQALAHLTGGQAAHTALAPRVERGKRIARAAVWWSAAWVMPVSAAILLPRRVEGAFTAVLILLGFAVYIATGLLLSLGLDEVAPDGEPTAPAPVEDPARPAS
jgi:hypothetical protein